MRGKSMETVINNQLGQWELIKSSGEDITFVHKEHKHYPGDTGEAGPIDKHTFDVYHKGQHIGTASAIHESDSMDALRPNVKERHPIEVRHALDRHLQTNAKKYMDMSPTYGKK
jgi:Tfp pilus assembly ATPase PilU